MTSSPIDFLRPSLLNDARIFSWFTLKNPHINTSSQLISGLNIGLNTKERQDILLNNLDSLATSIRTNTKHLALAEQVHKTNVQIVTEGGIYPRTDGFATNISGIGLGIQVADCGAVLLGDSINRVIGAAHAGWRGAVGGIVPKTIDKMISLGAQVEHIKAYISPCLAKHNFEVGEEVAEHFTEDLVNRTNYSKPHVDLKGLIRSHLIASGVQIKNIELDERCTIDHEELFYSYRREKEMSGRMVGIIKLNKLK